MTEQLFTIQALGTTWWIELFDELTPEQRTFIFDDCALFLRTFENNYSRFKPDSLISQLNTNRVLSHPPLEFRTLLELGLDFYHRSDGAFNFLVGETLLARGYDANYSFTPTESTVRTPSPITALTITDTLITLNAGSIDVGGYGKGFAIDCLSNHLKTTHGLTRFLINGGGDLYASQRNEDADGITIYLEHPTDSSLALAKTNLFHQGFAASSPHKRSWVHRGTTYTHIVATREIGEAPPADAVFVKAPSAAEADAFATVGLILSPTEYLLMAKREGFEAALFNLETNSLTCSPAFNGPTLSQ